MANGQIIKKFIADNAVDQNKVRLDNNGSLRGRNAADTADVNIIKVNTSDIPEFQTKSIHPFVPTAGDDIVNKTYADSLLSGVRDAKDAVRAASVANVDITSAPATIDGVALNAGDRVLLKNQSSSPENGIYVFSAAASALVRSSDFNGVAPQGIVTQGAFTWAVEGTVNARTGWLLTTVDPIVVGTTALTFVLTPIPASIMIDARETIVLSNTDITNGYIQLAQTANFASVDFVVEGAASLIEGVDYTLSNTGTTRLTFSVGLLALLAENDVTQVQYKY